MRKKTLYDMNYIRANYHRIDLKVPFDDYEKWKAAAEAEGLPVATWIKDKCNKAVAASEKNLASVKTTTLSDIKKIL